MGICIPDENTHTHTRPHQTDRSIPTIKRWDLFLQKYIDKDHCDRHKEEDRTRSTIHHLDVTNNRCRACHNDAGLGVPAALIVKKRIRDVLTHQAQGH